MRKTRLVILPGARCLNQIGCLLLFLACPMIAFKGQENREIEPYCRLLTLRQRWLSDDQEVADSNTCKHKPTGYKMEQDNAYWKLSHNQSYDTPEENGLLTMKNSFVRNAPLILRQAKTEEQVFLSERISRTRVEVNKRRSRDVQDVPRLVTERGTFLQGLNFDRNDQNSRRDSRIRQERNNRLRQNILKITLAEQRGLRISQDSIEGSRRIVVNRDSRLDRNKIERSTEGPRMDRENRERRVDRNIEKSRMPREIREHRVERNMEGPRMDREIRERRIERNIDGSRMDRDTRERRIERNFEKPRMTREIRERRVERNIEGPRMDRDIHERRVEGKENRENLYRKRFIDVARRETRREVVQSSRNSPERDRQDRRERRAVSLERTQVIRRNDLRSTHDIRRERKSVSLERIRETREPQEIRNRFLETNAKEQSRDSSRQLENRRNERASERLSRVARDVRMAREERRSEDISSRINSRNLRSNRNIRNDRRSDRSVSLDRFNRDARIDELRNNREETQAVLKDRFIRGTIRSDRRVNPEERRASLERLNSRRTDDRRTMESSDRLPNINRRVLTERASLERLNSRRTDDRRTMENSDRLANINRRVFTERASLEWLNSRRTDDRRTMENSDRLANINRRVLTERADRDTRDFRSFRNIGENRVQIRELASKRVVRNTENRREIRSDRVERAGRDSRDSREKEIILERRVRSLDNARESRVSLLERANQLSDRRLEKESSRKESARKQPREASRRIRERETRSVSLNNHRFELRNQNSPYFRSASRREVRTLLLDRVDQAREESRKNMLQNTRSISLIRDEREIRETRVNNRIEKNSGVESDSNIQNNRKIRETNERFERRLTREIKFESIRNIRTDRVRDDRRILDISAKESRNNIRMIRNDRDSRFRQSGGEKLSESNKYSLLMLVNGKANQKADQIMQNYGLNDFIPYICDKVSGLKSLSIRLWNSSMNVLGMKNMDGFISGGIMAVSLLLRANKKVIV